MERHSDSIVCLLSVSMNPERELIHAAARKPELRYIQDGRVFTAPAVFTSTILDVNVATTIGCTARGYKRRPRHFCYLNLNETKCSQDLKLPKGPLGELGNRAPSPSRNFPMICCGDRHDLPTDLLPDEFDLER
jgi:hypothetical protein